MTKAATTVNGLRSKPFILVLALLVTLSGCEMLGGTKRPKVTLANASLDALDLTGVTLKFDMRVTNPYAVPLPVAGLDYSLASRGARFLDGRTEGGVMIPASGSAVLPLETRVTFVDALKVLSSLKPGAVVPYTAELGVSVDPPGTERLRLPINTKGKFPIPTVPSISLASIRWSELSLSRAQAILDIDLTNTNEFALKVAGLGLDLALGGTSIVSSRADQPLDLSPGDEMRLEIPISFAPSKLGLAAFGMLRGKGATYNLKGAFDGGTPFGPLSLPFDMGGETTFMH